MSLQQRGTQIAISLVMRDLRIDINTNESVVVLELSGRLAGSTVTQLTSACNPIEGMFMLDLSNLKFADDNGVDVIQMLRKKGAQVRGESSFINLLINGESS
jgi:anti-anti-sigma regulatory factor